MNLKPKELGADALQIIGGLVCCVVLLYAPFAAMPHVPSSWSRTVNLFTIAWFPAGPLIIGFVLRKRFPFIALGFMSFFILIIVLSFAMLVGLVHPV
jgi:hypothetical protein